MLMCNGKGGFEWHHIYPPINLSGESEKTLKIQNEKWENSTPSDLQIDDDQPLQPWVI